MQEKPPADVARALGNRWPEAITAAVLVGIAILVIVDSLRVGNGWAEDGPEAGYFPFYIGVLLLAASATVLISTLARWRGVNEVFADREQLKCVAAVLLPMVVYVGLIFAIGIYLASFILIAYFMALHGKYKVPATLGVSIGVPVIIYLVFERWFLVLLPKGYLLQLLGL